MRAHVSAQFDIEDWNEVPFDEGTDFSKVTRARVAKRYKGDIEGTSTTEWLMAYAGDGSASFVGLERISGLIKGRKGSFVLSYVGSFEGGAARAGLG